MPRKLKVPAFKKEANEARWWDSHQNEIAEELERASGEGRLGRGTVARQGATPTTTIRLDPDDVARAKMLAHRKGLRYQTYLKMLIREALVREGRKLA